MDAIDRAIRNGYQKSDCIALQNKTWQDFEEAVKGKQVFLFGIGQGADFFYNKYKQNVQIEGIIDNNVAIQGASACFYISAPDGTIPASVRIRGIEWLDWFNRQEIVVLIASFRYHDEIAEQLEHKGISTYFSVLCMEAFERNAGNCNYNALSAKIVVWPTLPDGTGHIKEIVRNIAKTRNDVRIIWITKQANPTIPSNIYVLPLEQYNECIFQLKTAKIWLGDHTSFLPQGVKRNSQYYIQVKHWPSVTLKMFGCDEARFRNDHKYLADLRADSAMIDYILVGSDFDEKTCRSGFDFAGECIHVGSPRSDILFHAKECLWDITKTYPAIRGKKLLLYAPTFRRHEIGAEEMEVTFHNELDFDVVKKILEKRFGGEWVILLRLHPAVAAMSKDIPLPDYVIDVSDYYDSEELVAVSDAMVTDYSSIMFEPAFVHKPVFLLATDRERYVKEERGFLIDYETLPFPRASSNEELARNIENFDEEKYVRDVDAFLEKYGVHEDGHAGERAARFILDLIDGKRG